MPAPLARPRLRCLLTLLALGGVAFVARPATAASVSLTDEERQWIAAHPVVRVGYDVREAPYSMQERNGEIVGMDVDYLQLISERTGLRFQPLARTDWFEAMAQSPSTPPADLLTNVGKVSGRERYLAYSEAYAYSPLVIITRDDAPRSVSAADLYHQRVAVVRGWDVQTVALRKAAPTVVVVDVEDDAAAMQAVASGKCFAAIDDVTTALFFIGRLGLTHLRVGNSIPIDEGVYFGARRDWPALVQILDKGIASISMRERHAILMRWAGLDPQLGRWWARAFRGAAAVGGVIALLLLLQLRHNRRLQRELAERLRIQRELEETLARLAIASEEKSKILNMVAHDLRGPLTSITLIADLLEPPEPDGHEPPLDLPAEIRASARYMVRLIEELLSHHRLGAGPGIPTPQQVNLAAVARSAARQWSTPARAKRIDLTVTAPESLLLDSDLASLEKVIGNLVSNAVKYSLPGTAVTVAAGREGDLVRVEVSDQGPGVKAEEREQIFTQYGRGSAQPTSGETSHGLGLWIVRQLVTDLGGRVWCEEVSGPGARFVVELPVRPAPLAA